MVEQDRYCIDILTQTASVVSALKSVEGLTMKQHLETCVVEAMRSSDRRDQQQKID